MSRRNKIATEIFILQLFWVAGFIAVLVGFWKDEPPLIACGFVVCFFFQGLIVEMRVKILQAILKEHGYD